MLGIEGENHGFAKITSKVVRVKEWFEKWRLRRLDEQIERAHEELDQAIDEMNEVNPDAFPDLDAVMRRVVLLQAETKAKREDLSEQEALKILRKQSRDKVLRLAKKYMSLRFELVIITAKFKGRIPMLNDVYEVAGDIDRLIIGKLQPYRGWSTLILDELSKFIESEISRASVPFGY